MKKNTIEILCNPITKEKLRLETTGSGEEFLVGVLSGRRFPIKNDIPVFISSDEITGANKRYQGLYDKIARGYDFFEKIVADLTWGGRDNVRRDIVRGVRLNPGDRFLEVSVGTGINLRYLPDDAEFFGLDISSGMLSRCQRNLKKWKLQAELFQGTAEQLPFCDNSFDVVYHFGGINFFNDKKQAIVEMIRVAKGGASIFIGDENENVAKAGEKSKIPFAKEFYANRQETVTVPDNLLPPTMLNVKVEQRWKGRFYFLSFVKPMNA